MRDYYIVVTRVRMDEGPDDWKPYRNDKQEINQYDDLSKANGVMKCVFYSKMLSGDAKVMLKSEWHALQEKY